MSCSVEALTAAHLLQRLIVVIEYLKLRVHGVSKEIRIRRPQRPGDQKVQLVLSAKVLALLDGDYAAGDVSADVLRRKDIVDDDGLRFYLDVEIQFAFERGDFCAHSRNRAKVDLKGTHPLPLSGSETTAELCVQGNQRMPLVVDTFAQPVGLEPTDDVKLRLDTGHELKGEVGDFIRILHGPVNRGRRDEAWPGYPGP